MLAALLISPMTTVPRVGAPDQRACRLRTVLLLLSELLFAGILTSVARAARRPVQIAVHYRRRRPGRPGLSVLASRGLGPARDAAGRPGSRARPAVLQARYSQLPAALIPASSGAARMAMMINRRPPERIRRLLALPQTRTNYTTLEEASSAATSRCAQASIAYGV